MSTERPGEPAGTAPPPPRRRLIGKRALVILLAARRRRRRAARLGGGQPLSRTAVARRAGLLAARDRVVGGSALRRPATGVAALAARGAGDVRARPRAPSGARPAARLLVPGGRRHAADRRRLLPRLGARGRDRGPRRRRAGRVLSAVHQDHRGVAVRAAGGAAAHRRHARRRAGLAAPALVGVRARRLPLRIGHLHPGRLRADADRRRRAARDRRAAPARAAADPAHGGDLRRRLRPDARSLGAVRVGPPRASGARHGGRRVCALRRHLPARRRDDVRDEARAGRPGAGALPRGPQRAQLGPRGALGVQARRRAAPGPVAGRRGAAARRARTCAATRSGTRSTSPG